MKTLFKINIGGMAILAAAMLSACSNTNSNNASYAADSANKINIEKMDTAKKSMVAKQDSGDKKTIARADSAIKAQTKLEQKSADFLVKGFESGMFEIELAQLAAKKATNADIKALANMLITAHKDINLKMTKIALDAGFQLPGGIDSDHAKDLNSLDKLKGADFDKKVMDMLVNGHKKSVDNYSNAAKDLKSGVVKDFAAQTLPIIKEHLAKAQKISDKIK